MNNTYRSIQTIAAGIPMILFSETIAVAEDPPKLDPEPNSDRLIERQSETVQDLSHGNLQTPSKQVKPKNSSATHLAKGNLDPSTNLLELPAQARKVRIEINQPIGLQQAIDLGIKNNKNLQEARLNVERSRKELREAQAALYPALNTELNFSEAESSQDARSLELTRQQSGGSIDEDLSSSTFDGRINLTYDLYTGGLRGADIQRAKKQVRFSELDLERITFATRFEIVRDYYNLQNADSQVEIEQAAVNEARQTLQDAQLLTQAGIGTNFDVLRAEVELANARQRLTTAKAEQSTARRQLATTLSVGEQVELETADPIQPAGKWQLSLEETIVTAYKNRPELEQLLVQREINQKQKQIALSKVRPQVGLLASYSVLDVASDDVDVTDGYTVGARLQWDLFDGGAASAKAKQFETDIAINETQYANQRNLIRLEVEQGYFSLVASQDNIRTSEKAVKLAQDSLNLARMRFQSGVCTQTDVIQAQTELTTARANNIQAIINYNQSLNQLERAVTNRNVNA